MEALFHCPLVPSQQHFPFSHPLGPFSLQTLKNPKVEKAEILEIAVGYLREMNSAKRQGTTDQRGAGRGGNVYEWQDLGHQGGELGEYLQGQ